MPGGTLHCSNGTCAALLPAGRLPSLRTASILCSEDKWFAFFINGGPVLEWGRRVPWTAPLDFPAIEVSRVAGLALNASAGPCCSAASMGVPPRTTCRACICAYLASSSSTCWTAGRDPCRAR